MDDKKNRIKIIVSMLIASSTFGVMTFPQSVVFANKNVSQKKKKTSENKKEAPSPIKSQLPPIFPSLQANVTSSAIRDFVARDPNIMGSLDLSREAAATRQSSIRQLEGSFRQLKAKSAELMQTGDRLMRLREEQALYLENLRAVGLVDNRYPDLNFSIRSERNALINLATQLLAQFPRGPHSQRWQAASLISRIKVGDQSAFKDAQTFVKNVKTGDSTRVALVQAVYGPHSPGVYARALQLPMDGTSSAVIKVLMAERDKLSSRRIKSLYEEAARDGQGIQGVGGRIGPISALATAGLVREAITHSPLQADPGTVSVLQSLNAVDMQRHYLERIALNNLSQNPARAIAQYNDILSTSDLAQPTRDLVDLRILDIGLMTKNISDVEQQWQKMGPGRQIKGPQSNARQTATMDLAWATVQKSPSAENIDRLIRLNDFFSQQNQTGAPSPWALKILEALIQGKRFAEAAQRADALASSSQRADTQVAALRLAIKAREKILGLGESPAFKPGARLMGDPETAQSYVANLDKLDQLAKGPDSQKGAFQGGYVLYLSGQNVAGRQRLEAAIQKYPSHPLSPRAVSFLITASRSEGQHGAVEKVARMSEQLKITPFAKEHANVRGIIEAAVYSQAESLQSQGQQEAAADKYIAFQKEFPNSKNGIVALSKAVEIYIALQQTPKALAQLEALLKAYPTHPRAKDARWQAAELAQAAGQKLKAANHYEIFAQTYKEEGQRKQAYYLAGNLHKSLGRYSNAVTNYEIHLKDLKNNSDKLKVSREIAEIHVKYGKTSDALAALERMNRFSPQGDDEVWSLSLMIDIYLRQGQEALARRAIKRMVELRPSSPEAMKLQAKAKFELATLDAKTIRATNLQNETKLLQSLNKLIERYDSVKSLYLSQCEVPGSDSCSNGYYQTARLAEDVAKKILEIEIAPTLNPNEVAPLRQAIQQSSARLASESKAFATQAEDALSSGNVEADLADRIRAYSRQQKGVEER